MKKRIKAKKAKRVVVKAVRKQTVRVVPPVPPVAAAPAPAPKPAEPPKPQLATIQINAKYLRAMRHVAAKHDIRYYLNGVYFHASKDGGKFYVATDGHRIAVIQEPWGNGEEPQDVVLIIPRAVAEKATSILEKYDYAILKQGDAWTWTLQGRGDVHQTFKAIDGRFPEWQRVMPTEMSGKIGTFNWSYLHDLNLLTKEAFGRTFSCELQHNGDGAAIVTSGTNSFLGLVMPMRMSEGVIPQWALQIQKENAARKAKERAEAERKAANAEMVAEAA